MQRIAGGTFWMGSNEHYPEEGPARRVAVDGFWIDETPVTPEKILEALRRKEKGEPARVGPARFPDIPYPACIKVEPPPKDLESASPSAI